MLHKTYTFINNYIGTIPLRRRIMRLNPRPSPPTPPSQPTLLPFPIVTPPIDLASLEKIVEQWATEALANYETIWNTTCKGGNGGNRNINGHGSSSRWDNIGPHRISSYKNFVNCK